MPEGVGLLFIVFLPLLGALLPGLFCGAGRSASAWVAALVTVSALSVLLSLSGFVFGGTTLFFVLSWMPAVGLELAFRLDGLAMVFAGLVLGIGLLVIVYARYYLSETDPLGRFYGFLLLFMGAMLGVVLSENLLLLLFFWELTSLSSFLLIGYWSGRAEARRAARLSLTVTGAGGLALLGGFLLLGWSAGSFRLSVILQSAAAVQADPLYPLMLALILLGAFTKSAQFPLHFWLPYAMAAPTPVSAYLHSATMVKAGVFLLARLFPVLSGTDLWFFSVGGVGLVTLLFGAYTALFKHDLKGLLAYSTISHLGLITMLFGFGTPLGAVAGVFHVINHAVFKASLFMAAGIIDHESGSRDMRQLNGLWRFMPYTATLAIVAAAAMAGVPLLNGFLSKEMFFAETVHQSRLGPVDWFLPATATLAGVFAVAYSVRFIHDVFFNGSPVGLPRLPREPERYMRVPVEILVAICLLVGVLPASSVAPLLKVSAGALLGGPVPPFQLQIWHGFSLPFLMSLFALGGGVLLYSVRHHLFRLHDRLFPRFDANRAARGFFRFLQLGAARLEPRIVNGSLQRYVAVLIFSATAVAAVPFAAPGPGMVPFSMPSNPVALGGLLFLGAGVLATVAFHRDRLKATVAMSVSGLLLSLAFVLFSAPDLALTQMAVEVVSTVLLLLALFFLPQTSPRESRPSRRLRDGFLALAAGSGAAALSWAAMTSPVESISRFFLANAKEEAGGANVVNVILVDFRSFDTLGEITVLAMAGLIIYAMFEGLQLSMPDRDAQGRPWSTERHPLIMAVMSRPLLPLALVFSLFIFLRGHNEPGGGFIAGLVTGAALILQYMASGIRWAQGRLPLDYFYLMGGGVLIAGLTGAAAFIAGAPFLTSTFGHWEIPGLGELELASAMVFDLGVYAVVVGAVMLILANLGRLSHLLRNGSAMKGGM